MSELADNTALAARRQTGSVLVISLFFLVVLTLVGLAVLRTSIMDERMAANAMNKNMTFWAAESAIEGMLNEPIGTLNSALGATVNRTYSMNSADISSSAQITYLGQGIPVGYSLGANSGGFSAYRFQVVATGQMPAINVQTQTTQGLTRIAPGGS